MLKIITLIFSTLLLILGLANAQTACSENSSSTILASASTWDNIRNSEKSIKFKIGTLIKGATEGKEKASFTISSKPNKFLTEYSDKDYCLKKEQETLSNKLVFDSPELSSNEELNSWIGDFSQGKGNAGGDLYSKCDKSCSPSYDYKISFSSDAQTKNSKYKVQASVVCGHARDKDDNQYALQMTCGK